MLNLLLAEPELIPEAIEECAEHLNNILKGPKIYLKDIVLNILSVMVRYPQRGEDETFMENEQVSMLLYLNLTFLKDQSLSNIVENDNGVAFSMLVHFLKNKCFINYLKESIWKPLNQGFKPYQSKNILSVLRKKPKDSEIEYPAISDFSFISLPHMSEENLKHEQIIRQYISKIIEENSNSKDCMHLN